MSVMDKPKTDNPDFRKTPQRTDPRIDPRDEVKKEEEIISVSDAKDGEVLIEVTNKSSKKLKFKYTDGGEEIQILPGEKKDVTRYVVDLVELENTTGRAVEFQYDSEVVSIQPGESKKVSRQVAEQYALKKSSVVPEQTQPEEDQGLLKIKGEGRKTVEPKGQAAHPFSGDPTSHPAADLSDEEKKLQEEKEKDQEEATKEQHGIAGDHPAKGKQKRG